MSQNGLSAFPRSWAVLLDTKYFDQVFSALLLAKIWDLWNCVPSNDCLKRSFVAKVLLQKTRKYYFIAHLGNKLIKILSFAIKCAFVRNTCVAIWQDNRFAWSQRGEIRFMHSIIPYLIVSLPFCFYSGHFWANKFEL